MSRRPMPAVRAVKAGKLPTCHQWRPALAGLSNHSLKRKDNDMCGAEGRETDE